MDLRKRNVFIADEKLVWITATIQIGLKSDDYEVEITDEEYLTVKVQNRSLKTTIKTPVDELLNQNENVGPLGVDDMCLLDHLHEASILDNLRLRFKNQLPYTYTGDIIIAVSFVSRVQYCIIRSKLIFF